VAYTATAAGAFGVRTGAEVLAGSAAKQHADTRGAGFSLAAMRAGLGGLSGASQGAGRAAGGAAAEVATSPTFGTFVEEGASAVRWYSAAGIAAAVAVVALAIAFIVWQVRRGLA
jgi:hypothetical protein